MSHMHTNIIKISIPYPYNKRNITSVSYLLSKRRKQVISTLPCECAQMDMMMKTEKGELNHTIYLMTGYHIYIIKYVNKI